MTNHDRPPGWDYNPSSWRHRLPVLGLAVAGCAIATYLTLFQVDVLHTVWEPFFDGGTRYLLKESAVARIMPIPDASLGAFAYLCEAVADLLGGSTRWRTAPWAVLLLGLVACSLGVAGIVLAIGQPLLSGTYCTLCLASAACSVLSVGPAMNEVLAALQHLRRESASGRSWWHALWGTPGEASPTAGGRQLRIDAVERWAASLAAGVGLWLMVAPAALHFGGPASINSRILGPLAAGAGLIALHAATRVLRRLCVPLGIWLILSPWVLGCRGSAVPNSLSCGFLLLLCGLAFSGRNVLPGAWAWLWRPGSSRSGG